MAAEDGGYKVIMYDDIVECHIPASALEKNEDLSNRRQSERASDSEGRLRTDDLFNGNIRLHGDVNGGRGRDKAGASPVTGDGCLCEEKPSRFGLTDRNGQSRIITGLGVASAEMNKITSSHDTKSGCEEIECLMEDWHLQNNTDQSLPADVGGGGDGEDGGGDDGRHRSRDDVREGMVIDDFQWLIPVNIEIKSDDSGSDFLRDSDSESESDGFGYEVVPCSLSWETLELLQYCEGD